MVVMTKGGIIDTLIHACVGLIQNLSLYASGVAMLIFQTLLNFLVPSGSGQAAVSMPIMTPIADLIGMNRQIAVLIFQFGDGFSNIFWPTSVATEQILQMADAAFWNHVRVTMRLCFRRDRDELSINSGRFGFGI